jgi:hypothetical protein
MSAPSKWTPFNINQSARVKLTPIGEEVLNRHDERTNAHYRTIGVPYRQDWRRHLKEDGYYHDQLWSLMQVFGPAIGMGAHVPFETEIELDLKS